MAGDRVATLIRVFWVIGLASLGVLWNAYGPVALFALALHPLVVANNFVVSRVVSGRVPDALRLGPGGLLRLYLGELLASARGFWLATPFFLHRSARQPSIPRPEAIPILFVHGFFCNRAIFLSFMKDAAARGHVVEAVTLPFQFEAIERNAPAIDAALTALLARVRDLGFPARQVAIVAHSMGGLVARASLLRIDASRVAHVITLGTPHRGTWMARSGATTNVQQMQVDSTWLRALDEAERADSRSLPRAAFTTLYSAHDNVVFPQPNAALDGATCITIGGVGHVALAYDRKVRVHVFDTLARLPVG